MNKIAFLVITLLLCSCASAMKSSLGKLPEISTQNVTIVDSRNAQEKLYSRENFAPIQILGDDNFEPSIIELFRTELENRSVLTGLKYDITIEKLKIIDNFAARSGAALSGVYAGMGYTYTSDDLKNSDFVIFHFAGRVNGQAVNLQAAYPYHVSVLSVNTLNDDSFKEAVRKSVKDVVFKIPG